MRSVLGAAMLALVAAGAFGSLEEAAGQIVQPVEMIEPDPVRQARYEACYELYRATYFALLPVFEQGARLPA